MKNLLFMLLAATTMFGCSKSKTDKPAITMQTLAGNYKITSVTANGSDVLSLYLPACQQDDIYTLNADGSYAVTDAGITCDPSSATTGTWSLSGMQITLDAQQFTITNFDGSKIEATTSATQGSVTVTLDIVFTKQ